MKQKIAGFVAGIAATIAATFALSACGTVSMAEFDGLEPELKLEEYFAGHHKAHGFFRDRFGKVRRSFVVDIHGQWTPQSNTLILSEDFIYEDGSTEERIWTLRKTGPNLWEGTAPGVVGIASGQTAGNAFNWRYTFDLPQEDGSKLRVKFDDWMYLQPDDVLLNTATISKFGIRLGEVIISFAPARAGEAEMRIPAAAE